MACPEAQDYVSSGSSMAKIIEALWEVDPSVRAYLLEFVNIVSTNCTCSSFECSLPCVFHFISKSLFLLYTYAITCMSNVCNVQGLSCGGNPFNSQNYPMKLKPQHSQNEIINVYRIFVANKVECITKKFTFNVNFYSPNCYL
jgi:hypothetical protein